MSLAKLHHVMNGAELFKDLFEQGNSQLLSIREDIMTEQQDVIFKTPRTYIASEAANLIGRSKSWLREYELNISDPELSAKRDRRGHARYSLDQINRIRREIGTMPVRPEGTRPYIMPIFNYKGGVGKTTSAVHFAQYCALMGWRTLVIDLDPQGTGTYSLSGMLPDVDLKAEDTPYEALLDDPTLFGNIIQETYFPNVFLAPANLSLSEADITLGNPELNNQDTLGPSPLRIKKCIESVEEHFDIVVIDCPPNQGMLVNNAIIAATGITVPLPPKAYDRASFVSLCKTLSAIYGMLEESNIPTPEHFNILLTRHGGTRTELAQEQKIRALYKDYVLVNSIHQSAEIEGAAERMSTIYDLERPLRTKETYSRAIDIMNNANSELLQIITDSWSQS